jgi:hypothetical protein
MDVRWRQKVGGSQDSYSTKEVQMCEGGAFFSGWPISIRGVESQGTSPQGVRIEALLSKSRNGTQRGK